MNSSSIWNSPSLDNNLAISEQQLPDNLIEVLNLHWKSKRASLDFIKAFRSKFWREKNINLNIPILPKTMNHALGDLGEACVELSLIKGWEMSEKVMIKWIHPGSGSAPGRGIDIICFSSQGINDFRKGIWIFEVKSISAISSVDSQCSKIKGYINRNSTDIVRELLELLSWIKQISLENVDLNKYIAEFLMEDPSNIHLSGGIVYRDNYIKDKKKTSLKNKLRNYSRDDLRMPGLIFLYSNNLRKFAKAYKNGDVFVE